jgi:transcriptional regulator with XRE-family HTH domain
MCRNLCDMTEVGGTRGWSVVVLDADGKPVDSPFGERLAFVRARQGWSTTAAAADACGFARQNWANWEKGVNLPDDRMSKCIVINGVTGADLGWLAGGVKMIGKGPSQEALGWLTTFEQEETTTDRRRRVPSQATAETVNKKPKKTSVRRAR